MGVDGMKGIVQKLGKLLLLVWLVLAPSLAEAATEALILNYHHLDPRPTTSSTMSPELFAHQMKYLKDNGYNVISLEQLKKYLLSQSPTLPDKAVVITFDDGYTSFYEYAFPILKEYNFPSTMFTIVGRVGNTKNEVPKMSWAQIKELSATGLVDFQTHTWDMHYLEERKSAFRVETAEKVTLDLRLAADVLAFHTGRVVDAIAYPYGHVNDRLVDIANSQGYQLGFTLNKGTVHRGMNPMILPRVAVGDEGTTVQELEKVLKWYLE